MNFSISTNVLGIIALCFTINLAVRNTIVDSYKTKIYLYASAVTIILLLLEITTILLESSNINNVLILNKIVNAIGFSMSPLVPYIFILFIKEKIDRNSIIMAIPLLINALISVLSYRTGWLFYFNNQSQYVRGNFFYITTIIGMIYYLILIINLAKNNLVFDNDDKIFLNFLFTIPIFSTILQTIFPGLLIIWGSVALTLLIFYIFLRELQFKYDTISGIKNRETFEKEIEKYQKSYNNITIIMFDLNDFKKINDNLGHKFGDNAIYNAAKILKQSFKNIGEPYRLGGDEFCVICFNVSNEIIDKALGELEAFSNEFNKKNIVKIIFAYGYAKYTKEQSASIYDIIMQADRAMYEHKARLKGLNIRKKDNILI
ncbi:diguanylate cyclase (GGDEF)-like protein [Sedimentibacter acidaminivorans]|uniref:Diguanylate cyclase (GGDEF)-like protein n=1 Tax=Sedimentibacter acidaminivorans TaxID=913099 RepID=A0ABS4GH74_9FIRM|nr:GGDEF domain-containing protein [Sedimentibacter acidaminivorans]MBP1927031.1 diguanylate cyclase (GGDEF)-like protein [Sedimentibacter acidaminivorans]